MTMVLIQSLKLGSKDNFCWKDAICITYNWPDRYEDRRQKKWRDKYFIDDLHQIKFVLTVFIRIVCVTPNIKILIIKCNYYRKIKL